MTSLSAIQSTTVNAITDPTLSANATTNSVQNTTLPPQTPAVMHNFFSEKPELFSNDIEVDAKDPKVLEQSKQPIKIALDLSAMITLMLLKLKKDQEERAIASAESNQHTADQLAQSVQNKITELKENLKGRYDNGKQKIEVSEASRIQEVASDFVTFSVPFLNATVGSVVSILSELAYICIDISATIFACRDAAFNEKIENLKKELTTCFDSLKQHGVTLDNELKKYDDLKDGKTDEDPASLAFNTLLKQLLQLKNASEDADLAQVNKQLETELTKAANNLFSSSDVASVLQDAKDFSQKHPLLC